MELNAKTMSVAIISLAVAIILAISVLVPIIAGTTSDTVTQINSGIRFAATDDTENVHNISINMSSSGGVYVITDGDRISVPMNSQPGAVLAIGSNSILYVTSAGAVSVIKESATDSLGTVTSDAPIQLTMTGSTLGYTVSDVATTATGYLAYMAKSDDYVMAKNGYVTDSTDIIFGAYTATKTTENVDVSFGYCVNGTVSAIQSTDIAIPDPTLEATSSTISVELSEIRSNLKQISGMTIETAWSENTTAKGTTEITFETMLVPMSVSYTNPNPITGPLAALINVIPLLVIIGLLIGTLAYMKLKN